MPTNTCRILEWDSDFFGIRIGRIESNSLTASDAIEATTWCLEQGVQCLYFLCASDDDESIRNAEANLFHLVDIRVDLNWKAVLKTDWDYSTATKVRLFHKEDESDLIKIAANSYTDSRFYVDRNFAPERVSGLYQEWIRKSCQGLADAVLVSERADGLLEGFITCHKEPSGAGRIGLTGVHSQARRTGSGERLVEAAQAYFIEQGVSEVLVATQGRNIAAQRLYQKRGFRSHSVQLWYHRWFTVS